MYNFRQILVDIFHFNEETIFQWNGHCTDTKKHTNQSENEGYILKDYYFCDDADVIIEIKKLITPEGKEYLLQWEGHTDDYYDDEIDWLNSNPVWVEEFERTVKDFREVR